MRPEEIPWLSLDELQRRYAGVLFDAYGVLVDHCGPLPGAGDLLGRLRADGRFYCVVTNNSSMLPETTSARYRGWGLDLPAERIITSGSLLPEHFAAEGLQGSRCAVLGGADAKTYVRRAGGEVVPLSADATVDVLVVCDQRGYPLLEGLDAALSLLFRQLDAGRQPRLVLPNPDPFYPAEAGRYGITAGSLALILEAALARRYPGAPGIEFVRLGKPHAPMFREALRRAGGVAPLLMVGDQLETDIRGALSAGVDAALVTGGVTRLDAALAAGGCRPTWLLEPFAGAPGAPCR